MLAKICEGIPDAIAQLRDHGGRFLAEFKYDGVRAQIHLLEDGSVSLPPVLSARKCSRNDVKHQMSPPAASKSGGDQCRWESITSGPSGWVVYRTAAWIQARHAQARFGCSAQWSLLRAQVKVFSRNCEDRSTHFPDVANAIRAAAAGSTLQTAPHPSPL